MQRNGITLPPIVVRPDKQDEYLHYLGQGDGSGRNVDFAPLGEILDLENAYKSVSGNLAQVLEVELAHVRNGGDSIPLPPLEALARELRFRDSLIVRKYTALLSTQDVAIQRFGQAQVERFYNIGRLPQVNRRNSGVTVLQAYSALFNAKLLVVGIGLLNTQSARLREVVAVVQAQETERIAQEQARLAAEHARQVAEEQARAAQDQARRMAQELARIAAANEIKRLAEEQARLAAQARERKLAEERATLEAEAEARRLAEEKRRLEDAEQANRSIEDQRPGLGHGVPLRLQGNVANAQLVFATSSGAVAIADNLMAGLAVVIRSAVAGLSGLAAGTASGLMVGVSAFIYSPTLGNGELPERFVLSHPLSDLLPGPLPDLHRLASERALLDLPVRLSPRPLTSNLVELLVVPVGGKRLPSGVRVIAAGYNPGENTYGTTLTDLPPTTVVWTPSVTPTDSSAQLPVEESAPPRYFGGNLVPIEGRIDTYPVPGNIHFDDFILVFPPESGLPPQYVMFRDRRNDPGVASGYGEPVPSRWLEAAAQGEGAAIPLQIADKLRGKEFKSFRVFRETFWKTVFNDGKLADLFNATSLNEMKKGKAPIVRFSDTAGARVKYELHHKVGLAEGGDLYNADNINIVTPKAHVEIHKGL
ncbi:S-type pyocin domain-containing protein [Pseudomonas shahriarae]|uniref:S-type pyocin domain-containing protein n=1 Tax=Pseudomonas shahriarae TaxID=2745512 RepID=A0A9X4C6K1_9PSED|nr:S-type pyocin domain-containing protein [Pseudomonas shahriarae]MDD1011231.1 S-type pyocin domain-containing protein [Pseudomonas shahriarae]